MTVQLKPITKDHVDDLYRILLENKSSIQKYISLGDLSKQKLLDSLATTEPNLYLGIFKDDELCGQIRLEKQKAATGPALNLAYWVAAPHRGKGIATEAVRILLTCEFGGRQQIQAEIKADNFASQHVVARNGFVLCKASLPWKSVAEAITVAGTTAVPSYKQVWIWSAVRPEISFPAQSISTSIADDCIDVKELLSIEKEIESLVNLLQDSAKLPRTQKSPFVEALEGFFSVDDGTQGAIVVSDAVVLGPIQQLKSETGETFFQEWRLHRVDATEAHFHLGESSVVWKRVHTAPWISHRFPTVQGIWRRPIGNYAAVFDEFVIVADKESLRTTPSSISFRTWVTAEPRLNTIVWKKLHSENRMIWTRHKRRTVTRSAIEIARRNLRMLKLAQALFIEKSVDQVLAEQQMRELMREVESLAGHRKCIID